MVNETVENGEQGRLFAVVSIAAVQRRVTVEDIIIVEAEFPPNIGDRIRLEKVSLRFDTMWQKLFTYMHVTLTFEVGYIEDHNTSMLL